VLAHRIGETLRGLERWRVQTAEAWTGALGTYVTEEEPLVASRAEIERFNREVDRLRDDVARLEARIAASHRDPPGLRVFLPEIVMRLIVIAAIALLAGCQGLPQTPPAGSGPAAAAPVFKADDTWTYAVHDATRPPPGNDPPHGHRRRRDKVVLAIEQSSGLNIGCRSVARDNSLGNLPASPQVLCGEAAQRWELTPGGPGCATRSPTARRTRSRILTPPMSFRSRRARPGAARPGATTSPPGATST